MRQWLLGLLLVLNTAWALPAKEVNLGGNAGGEQTQGDIVWPVGI